MVLANAAAPIWAQPRLHRATLVLVSEQWMEGVQRLSGFGYPKVRSEEAAVKLRRTAAVGAMVAVTKTTIAAALGGGMRL